MIGRSKNGTENYPRECFWTQEKETWVKFNPGLSANRPSNNWAQGLNSLLAGDPLRRTVRAGLEGFRLRESWLLKKWWSTMPPSQRLSFFALWSHRLWWSARDHGMEKEDRLSDILPASSFPPSFTRKKGCLWRGHMSAYEVSSPLFEDLT